LRVGGQETAGWLQNLLALPGGIPSHDTVSRLFPILDPDALDAVLPGWVPAASSASAISSVIAVDGKTLRRSHDHGQVRDALHLISLHRDRYPSVRAPNDSSKCGVSSLSASAITGVQSG